MESALDSQAAGRQALLLGALHSLHVCCVLFVLPGRKP